MAEQRTGFVVTSQIVTNSTDDTYPIAETNDIKGATHYVAKQADLAGISSQHLVAGMSAYVSEENAYYDLQSDLKTWKKRVTYEKDLTPWTRKDCIHAGIGHDSSMAYLVRFDTNPDTGTDKVIVDPSMESFASVSDLKDHIFSQPQESFKIVLKTAYNAAIQDATKTTAEQYASLTDGAKAVPYVMMQGDVLTDTSVQKLGADGTYAVDPTIVFIQVAEGHKLSDFKQNDDGKTYSLGDTYPTVILKDNAEDTTNVVVGQDVQTINNEAVAVGHASQATGRGSVAVGSNASAKHLSAIALGQQSNAGGSYSMALGDEASSEGDRSAAIGKSASASAVSTLAAGDNAFAGGEQSLAVGTKSKATGTNAIAVGNINGDSSGNASIAIGYNATASFSNATAIGSASAASASNTLALGANAEAKGENSVALGAGNKTDVDETGVVSVGAKASDSSDEVTHRIIHVADAVKDSDAVTKKQLDAVSQKIPDVPKGAKFTDTTYDLAVASDGAEQEGKAGLMSPQDKAKLDAFTKTQVEIETEIDDKTKTKAEISSVYTKEDADKAFVKTGTVYTKEDADSNLNLKVGSISWKEPAETAAALNTEITDAKEGTAVYAKDQKEFYVYKNSSWSKLIPDPEPTPTVTTTTDGLMSKEDKVKLDGLQNIDTSRFLQQASNEEDQYLTRRVADGIYFKIPDSAKPLAYKADVDTALESYRKKSDNVSMNDVTGLGDKLLSITNNISDLQNSAKEIPQIAKNKTSIEDILKTIQTMQEKINEMDARIAAYHGENRDTSSTTTK